MVLVLNINPHSQLDIENESGCLIYNMEVNMKIEEGQAYDKDDFSVDIVRMGNRGDQYNLACEFQEELQIEVDDPEYLMEWLREFGAWEYDELQDHKENLIRLIWIMGGDIAETGIFIYSH